jgi:hypothetical protein
MRGGIRGILREVTMTYQLFPQRSNFCRYAVEAWVLIGVMCERRTFYGDDGRTVRSEAMRWVRDQVSRAS